MAAREALLATFSAGWPFRNVYNMVQACGPPEVSDYTTRPYHDRLSDYVGVQASCIPKILICAVCFNYTVDMDAAAEGYDFGPGGWIQRIVWRDLLLMVFICGTWDWLLYASPLRDRLAPYKFNPSYPTPAQFRRDIFWTTSATLLASAQEVLLMRWWAGGYFRRALFSAAPIGETHVPWGDTNPFFGNEYTPYYVLWIMCFHYWVNAHFFFTHRAMHPWWSRDNGLAQGDLGAVLYRHVHFHHHRSYNPTAFSGLSMLPIESTVYISAALVPLLFRSGCHPFLHLYFKLELIFGAQIGHDGFDAPGGGCYYHQLHHAHFECNYGDNVCPLDWLFGTFEDGSSFEKAAGVKRLRDEMVGGDGKAEPLLAKVQPITMEEVARHCTRGDCWIVIYGTVLDVTEWMADHPGGEQVLLAQGGKDATAVFEPIHQRSGGFALVQQHAPSAPIGFVPQWTAASADPAAAAVGAFLRDALAQVCLHLGWVATCVLSWFAVMGDM